MRVDEARHVSAAMQMDDDLLLVCAVGTDPRGGQAVNVHALDGQALVHLPHPLRALRSLDVIFLHLQVLILEGAAHDEAPEAGTQA